MHAFDPHHTTDYVLRALPTPAKDASALAEVNVEIQLRAAPEFIASLQNTTQPRSRHSLQTHVLNTIDTIATSDFRMAELLSFAHSHHDDVLSIPDKIDQNTPMFAPEGGRYFLAQATEENAADFMQLIPSEKRFGL